MLNNAAGKDNQLASPISLSTPYPLKPLLHYHSVPLLKRSLRCGVLLVVFQMLWLFGRAGYRDDVLMDMMHDVALKLSDKMDSTSLAEVVFAEAQMGWADNRVQALVADYALDNIQVGAASSGV